jgi:hypothetical protein
MGEVKNDPQAQVVIFMNRGAVSMIPEINDANVLKRIFPDVQRVQGGLRPADERVSRQSAQLVGGPQAVEAGRHEQHPGGPVDQRHHDRLVKVRMVEF